jgi:hypothetical protein
LGTLGKEQVLYGFVALCQQLICVSIDVQFFLSAESLRNESRDYHKYLLLWGQYKMKLPLVKVCALPFSLHAVVLVFDFYLKHGLLVV